ncbi:KxDL motif-containing protein 1 [Coemansia sp. RSA 353]|nr:KxDL motif-containing protein 1 [Coemansia sp. RSA 788]KAJ2168908.1 KxDL motif-containing protein 1 [Coemansia sp. RSA 562]KAJ2191629.1 KxDL motif-containing protein 1 [Coemansia sp. RSA 532]KAJ2200054.1 KxDL motif-containing protein 1 [Coemansia sp. RSA 530]KAJ2201254.1 KxDL motif-containing protein 1 [Coemansia sp. RSA 522]KAJ2209193.1 KxDL motif-containing protein 1 [Coemansia sp. RSA 521]KAJ2278989.1 KxDL motif-containing protein 1 [Coemansia sp. RSA 371]KAJ2284490.1 KxDL motif-contai
MSTSEPADTTNPTDTKPSTRANTALSTSIPGLPALDLSPTLNSQKEQLEIYRHLLETLAQSEQESALIFPTLSKSLTTHTATLVKLKDDLHNVFMRIRALKTRFQSEYPDAFDYVQSLHVKELEDE